MNDSAKVWFFIALLPLVQFPIALLLLVQFPIALFTMVQLPIALIVYCRGILTTFRILWKLKISDKIHVPRGETQSWNKWRVK